MFPTKQLYEQLRMVALTCPFVGLLVVLCLAVVGLDLPVFLLTIRYEIFYGPFHQSAY